MTIPLLAKAAILGGAAYIATRVVRSRRLASPATGTAGTPVAPLPNNDAGEDVRSFTPVAAISRAVYPTA